MAPMSLATNPSQLIAACIAQDGPVKVLLYRSAARHNSQPVYVAHSLRYGQSANASDPQVAVTRLIDQLVVYLLDCCALSASPDQRRLLAPDEVLISYALGREYTIQRQNHESGLIIDLKDLEVQQVYGVQADDEPLETFVKRLKTAA